MITLKEALKLPKDAIKEIRDDLKQKIEASRSLGAYVEQFTCKPISEYGEGIPIVIHKEVPTSTVSAKASYTCVPCN